METNKTIWKYPLYITDIVDIDMPICAKILDLQIQKGIPCLWVLVDPTEKLETRTFIIHGTGHDISYPESKKYIGTYLIYDDELVLHLFELLKQRSNTDGRRKK